MASSRTTPRTYSNIRDRQDNIRERMPMHRDDPTGSSVVAVASGIVLVLAVVLVYMNSIAGPFILDDAYSVRENRHIRSLWPLSDAMFKAIPDSPPAGRPIVALSLAVNYALGGFDVRGYHIFNISVHVACVLALWGVLRRSLLNAPLNVKFGRAAPFLAFAIALIWAVHPLSTESVTYVSQRTELLMGLFYLLTLYCAIRSWQSPRQGLWSVVAVACCAMGMGCKEAMVSAPLIVLLYDVMLVSRSWREALKQHARLYIGLGATWGVLALLNLSGPRSATCGAHLGLSSLDYLRTQAGILVRYLQLCLWPHPLVITYDDWPVATSFLEILPQGLLIVSLLALTAWAVMRRQPLGLLGAWFFLILAPTSSFIPIVTEIAAERRMYLPSISVIIMAFLGCHELLRVVIARAAVPERMVGVLGGMLVMLAASVLGGATFLRNRDYQSAVAIWTDTLAKRPQSWMALNNLCMALLEKSEHEQVIQYCNQAIERKPTYADGHYNRGLAYEQKDDREHAMRDYTRAIELKPSHAKAYNNRAILHGEKGEFAQAIRDCSEAIRLKPDYAEAYYNRGQAFDANGDRVQAIQDYTTFISLEPGDAEVYNNRARAYCFLKQYDQALADVRRCRQLGGIPAPDLLKNLAEVTGRAE